LTPCGFVDANRCAPKAVEWSLRWTSFVRGDIHRLGAQRWARVNEQKGVRYAVIVQSDDLMLSTVLVSPERLGKFVGRVTNIELAAINSALRLALELD
jgi:mRNA interferase MazF